MTNYEMELEKTKDIRHLAMLLSQSCKCCPLALKSGCLTEINRDLSCYKLVLLWLKKECEENENE